MTKFVAPQPLTRRQRFTRPIKNFWNKYLRPIIEPAFISRAQKEARRQAEKMEGK